VETSTSVAQPKSTGDIIRELWLLLQTYAKQQTVDPLKNLGRYLAWGIGGSLLVVLGVFFLAMSMLRALQSETGDTFDGNLSWFPYVATALALAVVAALAVAGMTRKANKVTP